MQRYERGWGAISLYTGVSVGELRRAAVAGEFACRDLDVPKVKHWRLDAWLLARQFPQLVDQCVELLPYLNRRAERPAVDIRLSIERRPQAGRVA